MHYSRWIKSCCLLLLIWGAPARGEPNPGADSKSRLTPPADVESRCRAVEQILSRDCAASLARELCGDTSMRGELASEARTALKNISDIRKLLEGSSESGDSQSEHLTERLERLEQFGTLFACLGELDDSEQTKKKLIAACGALAAYFDEPEPAIAEAAKLWQGMAYRRARRVDRALQVLRPVLSKPIDIELGFWLRVERCRALADRGDATAAIALCLRLEKRIGDWFDEDQKDLKGPAENTLCQLRATLWKRWSQQLKEAGKEKDADEAARQARELAEPLLRIPEKDRCLPLTHALPRSPENTPSSSPAP